MNHKRLIDRIYSVKLLLSIFSLSFSWCTHPFRRHAFPLQERTIGRTFPCLFQKSSRDIKKGRWSKSPASYTSSSDDEFKKWIYGELVEEAGSALVEEFGSDLFHKISACITRWRQRYRDGDGSALLWKRLFKRDRVVKEIIESLPIVHAMDAYFLEKNNHNVTIIDLCSGKGYLSMLLSEYLPHEKVRKLVLVDKAWPMCFAEPRPHHINWDHIYGNYTIDNGEKEASYFSIWPIPLHTSKQDLKSPSTMRQLKIRFSGTDEAIFILAVHLCGTLSIQAVKLFHELESAQGLILKPCCLPGMVHSKRQPTFHIDKYGFPTADVCAPGYWKNKEWEGPPRWHLEKKFHIWSHHLHQGMKQDASNIQTRLVEVPVQTNGGFQNTFLFAEKQPTTSTMWEVIPDRAK